MTILFTNWSIGIYVATSLLFGSPISGGSKTVEKTEIAKTQVKEGKGCKISQKKTVLQVYQYGWDGTQYRRITSYDPDNCIPGAQHCLATSSIDYGETVPSNQVGNLNFVSEEGTQYDF